jgi:hypothetical protein
MKPNNSINLRKGVELCIANQGLSPGVRSRAPVSLADAEAAGAYVYSEALPVASRLKAPPAPTGGFRWHWGVAPGLQLVMLWALSLNLVTWADSATAGAESGPGRLESAMEVRNLDRENPFADDWIRKRFASLQDMAKELADDKRAIGEAGAAVVRVMNAYINDANLTNKALVSREIVMRAGEIAARCEAVTRGETNFQNAVRQLRAQLQERVENGARQDQTLEANLTHLRSEYEQLRQAVQNVRKDLEGQGYLSGAKTLEPERAESLARLVVAYRERALGLQIQEESLARCHAHQGRLAHVDGQFEDAERASRLTGVRASSAARLARLIGECERANVGRQLDLLGIEDAAGFAADFTRDAMAGINPSELTALLDTPEPLDAERTNAVSVAPDCGRDQGVLNFFKHFNPREETHE